jgi:phosphoglycerol transferase
MSWLIALALGLVIALLVLRRYRNSTPVQCGVAAFVVLFVVLSAMYLAADYFTGNGIDDSVLYHLGYGLSGAGFAEYSGIIVFSSTLIVAALLLARWLYLQLGPAGGELGPNNWNALIASLFPLACLLHPTSLDLAALYDLGPDRFLQADASGKSSGQGFAKFYKSPEPTPPRKLPNLVIFYLESLERTYFDEARFPGLITELRELEKESLSFTNIRRARGTGFTIGGMVASQCGIPLVTSSHPNSMAGMDRFLPGAECLGDLLATAGYQLEYMGGASLEFAGKGKFYKTHGFQQVRGREELQRNLADPDYTSYWGLYDDTTLEMAYQRYQEMAAGKRPFALVTLTLDTHHPDGHPSRSCDGIVYGDGSNPILNAVRCSDKLAAQFIRKIRQSAARDNTLLVVASDHLAMRNTAYKQLQQGKRTNLLMIFDPSSALKGENSRPGTTLDAAPTMLSAMGFDVDAHGLGRSLLGNQPNLAEMPISVSRQLGKWQDDLAGFWDIPSSTEGITIDASNGKVTIAGRNFLLPILIEYEDSGEISALKFEHDSPEALITFVKNAPPGRALAWIDSCKKVRSMDLNLSSRGYCLFLGKIGASSPLIQKLERPLTISRRDIEQYAMAQVLTELAEKRVSELASTIQNGEAGVTSFARQLQRLEPGVELTLRSSGGPEGDSGLVTQGNEGHVTRGLHLLGLRPGSELIHLSQFDPCSTAIEPHSPSLDETMAQTSEKYAAYLILVHDSAICDKSPLQRIFANLPLERWHDIGLRTPYLAVLPTDGSAPLEIVGDKNTSLLLNLQSVL